MNKKLFEKLNQQDKIEYMLEKETKLVDSSGNNTVLILCLLGANLMVTLSDYRTATKFLFVGFVIYYILVLFNIFANLFIEKKIDNKYLDRLKVEYKGVK